MKEETLKVLTNIYNQTSVIFNIYTLLIRMELLNKVSTEEYQTIVNTLKVCIEEEKKLYNYFKENPLEVIPATIFVSKKDKNDDDFVLASEQNPYNMITARITRYFFEERCKDPIRFLDNLDLEQFYCIDDEPVDIGFQYLYEMIPNIRNTAKRRMISYLEKEIKHQTNFKIKDFLIKAKFYLNFLDINLEDYYINFNFQNIPNRFNEEIKVTTVVSPTTEENLKNLYAKKYLEDAICLLFNIENIDDMPTKAKTVSEAGLIDSEKYQRFLYNLGLLELSVYYFSNVELKKQSDDLYDKIPKFPSDFQKYFNQLLDNPLSPELVKEFNDIMNKSSEKQIGDLLDEFCYKANAELKRQTQMNINKQNFYLYTLNCVFLYIEDIKNEANKDLPKTIKEK
ncbi:MAG: hypothetical protein GX265_02730 [Mollicutes bacterium]|nr:hypothetical protein [Mollicutes bacterium]